MNFKTPFKVLTTAALIGTLSLSAVAPGAASAAEKTVTAQAETPANFAIEKVILVKGDSKISVSFDTYIDALGNEKALNGYELAYVVAANGEVFALETYVDFYEEGNTEKEVVEKLSKAGKTSEVTEVKDGAFNDGKLEPVEDTAATAKVESVSAINAKTLEVTFNKSLTDEQQAEAAFTVKRGASNVAVTATWSEDGKSAKLASGANLLTGEHTVTVTGLTEEALTGNVAVAAVKGSSLEILASVLNDETAKAKLNVELKDQYGEKIALTNNAFTVTAYNKTQASNVPVTFDATDGFVIDTNSVPADFKKDDVVTVTVIHNATGLKVTKELKVDNAATLSTVTVGDIVLPTGKTILTADLKDIKAPISAKDQFGSDIKPTTADFKFISSDDTIVAPSDVTVSSDGKNLNIANFKKAGNVTLTILAKASGETATVTLDVQEAPGTITSVVLAETAGTIAAGSTKVVGLDVKDNYGTAIKVSDYSNKLTFSSTNGAVVDNNDISINAKGELSIQTQATATKGNKSTVTVLSNGKAVATYEVTAGEVPVPTTIDVASTSKHSTKLAVGANTTITFNALDQYGSVAGSLGTFTTDYTVKGAADNITLSDKTATSVKVTAAKAGTAVVLAELKNSSGVVVASKEVTMQVVANNSDSGLKIDDVPTLAKGNKAAYKEAVEVVTADGTALPSTSIVSVTSSDSNVASISGDAVNGFFVTGKAVKQDSNSNDIDTKATITVVYNADDKPVTLTKEVTVSATPITATDLMVTDKAQVTGKTLTKDAVEVTSTSVEDFAALSTLDLYSVIKDNFGIHQAGNDVSTVANVSDVNDVVISITNKVGYTDEATADTITLAAGTGKLEFNNFAANTITSTSGKASFRILMTNGSKVQYVDVAVDGKTATQKTAEALAKIATFAADSSKPAPTVADYTTAGITDVTASNLAAVNTAIDGKDVSTAPKTQAIVDTTIINAVAADLDVALDAEQLELPAKINGVDIVWSSAAEAVVSDKGAYVADGGPEVLTATLDKGTGTQATATFNVTAASGEITVVTKVTP